MDESISKIVRYITVDIPYNRLNFSHPKSMQSTLFYYWRLHRLDRIFRAESWCIWRCWQPLVMAWLNIKRSEGPGFIKGFIVWASGVTVGFAPILWMALFIPGFAAAFWESVRFLI